MEILKTILSIILAIDCIAIIIVVLMQQAKGQGLGALAGTLQTNDTYWGKNKGRSQEETQKKLTKIFTVIFFALSIILNMSF